MSNTAIKVRDIDTGNFFFVEGVSDDVNCQNMNAQFPQHPTEADLARLVASLSPAGVGQHWEPLNCLLPDPDNKSEKIKGVWVRRIDGFDQLSVYADGTGVLRTVLTATGGTPTYPIADGSKTMTTEDGPYSSDGLFVGTVRYGQLFSKVVNGGYNLRVVDEDDKFLDFPLVVTTTLPDSVLLAPTTGNGGNTAAKITDEYLAINDGGSLSIYARATGDVLAELIAVEGTPTYSNGVKKMTTEAGGYTRPGLFIGAATHGALFSNVPRGKYDIRLTDNAGGVDVYTRQITSTGPIEILKGTAEGTSTGGGGGNDGSVPTIVFTGQYTISENGRPDLFKPKVTVFQKEDGSYWFRVKDEATGNFPNKVYLTNEGEHFIRQAQLEGAEFPFGFPWSCVVGEQPWSTGQDGGVMDRSAHCSVKIHTS